jgi:AcrR family transcriptional regulator/DNA-binding MarR family transcriptional regulator
MAEEVAIRGASSVTVARVIARAGVSRRLFYELFVDVEDCLLATFDWAVEQASARAVDAYTAQDGWRERTRGGLAALLRFFDEQPLLAQLCIVHAAGGGPRVLQRRSQVIAQLCEAIDSGRSETSGSGVPGPVVAEGVVGAVLAVLYTRLLTAGSRSPGGHADGGHADGQADGGHADGQADGGHADGGPQEPALIALHGELMSLIVLPYLGRSVAGRELARPAPPPRPRAPSTIQAVGRSTLEAPGARLTYRTVRVLRAIAELPAASNREVAERAGVVDQGQISKILTRLEYQGLVINRREGRPARGTPNAWWLTTRGEALARELREPPIGERDSESQPGKGSGSRRPAT